MLRIASLSPATTEILCALGLQGQIIVRDQYSDYPESVKNVQSLKGHTNIDVGKLLQINPDIIFTSTVIQEQLAERIRTFDKSVVHHDPRTVHQIYEVIRNLGVMWQKEPEAEQLVLHITQELNALKKKVTLLPRRLRVYVEEWPNPPMASANWVPELIRAAGGEPFEQAKAGGLSAEFSFEALKAWDPELIVLSWCGAGLQSDKDSLHKRAGWNDLLAVKQGNIRIIDDSLLNRPGPRLVEGAQQLYGWIFELLH